MLFRSQRRRRKEARPQELLDAALSLFVEKGFAATRAEEVAQRAGVSKGTLYLYFPSKEELLKAVIRHYLGEEVRAGALEVARHEDAEPAALFGVLTTRDRGGPLVAGAGAMLAWASLLVYDATRGPVGTVAATVGGVLQMKPVGVYALTLAYAGLIAVCAAVIGRAVARTARPT